MAISELCCIILNYNTSDLTIALAKSLVNNCPNLKICIVDNCSSDDSWKKINEVNLGGNTLRVKTEYNSGYSYGNNYGFIKSIERWADLGYIAIMNPDIIVNDYECFCHMVNILSTDENMVAIKPRMKLNGNECDLNRSGWKLASKHERIWAHTMFDYYKRNYEQDEDNNENLYITDVLGGSFFIIKRDIFERINGFDTNVFLYCEESILALKIKNEKKEYYCAVDLKYDYNHNHRKLNKKDSRINWSELYLYKSYKYMFVKYYNPNVLEYILFIIIQSNHRNICLLRTFIGYYKRKLQ